MVLVIGIISLLVVLLMPSLAGVRDSARDTVSLARMRENVTVFATYATDWDDYSPYSVHPDATLSVFRGGGMVFEIEYFWGTEFWNIPLLEEYYDNNVANEVFVHPGAIDNYLSFRLTSSFYAAPSYWIDDRERDLRLWRGVRVTETAQPSKKAWLTEFHPKRGIPIGIGEGAAARKGIGLAFVDGHAARHDGDDLTTPCLTGDGRNQGQRFGFGVFGMHTRDGVEGNDTK